MHWLEYPANGECWEQASLPCFSSWGEKIQSFTIKDDISYKLTVDTLYQIEEGPFKLLSIFIMNKCWILLNTFPASIEMLICYFSLIVNMLNYIDWHLNVKPILESWNESYMVIFNIYIL